MTVEMRDGVTHRFRYSSTTMNVPGRRSSALQNLRRVSVQPTDGFEHLCFRAGDGVCIQIGQSSLPISTTSCTRGIGYVRLASMLDAT